MLKGCIGIDQMVIFALVVTSMALGGIISAYVVHEYIYNKCETLTKRNCCDFDG